MLLSSSCTDVVNTVNRAMYDEDESVRTFKTASFCESSTKMLWTFPVWTQDTEGLTVFLSMGFLSETKLDWLQGASCVCLRAVVESRCVKKKQNLPDCKLITGLQLPKSGRMEEPWAVWLIRTTRCCLISVISQSLLRSCEKISCSASLRVQYCKETN